MTRETKFCYRNLSLQGCHKLDHNLPNNKDQTLPPFDEVRLVAKFYLNWADCDLTRGCSRNPKEFFSPVYMVIPVNTGTLIVILVLL